MYPALKKAAVAVIASAALVGGTAGAANAVAPTGTPWVGDGAVVAHLPLHIRYGPSTGHWIAGHYYPGRQVWLTCKVRGENIFGNNLWYRLSNGRGYVSARYVRNFHHIPWCR